MHRTDAPGFAPGNLFTEGDPQLGVPFSHVSDDWLNDVQENLCQFIESEGIALVKGNHAQLLDAIRRAYGKGGLRNRLLNGAFEINQRADSYTGNNATAVYTLDRWRFAPGASNSNTWIVDRTGADSADFATGARTTWSLKVDLGAAGLNGSVDPILSQRIESILTFAGGKATLSFTASKQSGAGTAPTITPKLVQHTGSSGAGVVSTTTGAVIAVTDTPTRYVVTFDVPAVAQQTIGVDSYLELQLVVNKAATRDLFLRAIQLEVGGFATAFEERPEQVERLLCQRFYETSYPKGVGAGEAGTEGMAATFTKGFFSYGLNTRFRVEKRAVPTVRWYSPNDGAADTIVWGGAAGSNIAATPEGESTSASGWPGHTNQTTADHSWGHWTADAEL